MRLRASNSDEVVTGSTVAVLVAPVYEPLMEVPVTLPAAS